MLGDSSGASRDSEGIPPLSPGLFPADEDGEISPRPLYIAAFFGAALPEPTLIRNFSFL